jgi:hypothetical protein
MPVEIKHALMLMVAFGSLLIALIGLVVTIILALNHNQKK